MKKSKFSESQIMNVLKYRGVFATSVGRNEQMRVSNVLVKWGWKKATLRVNGKQARGYKGVRILPAYEKQSIVVCSCKPCA